MLLSAENLVCARTRRALFAPQSFMLPPGGCVVLRGDNGSGKTTLLRTLAGLCRPQAGIVRRADEAGTPLYLGHRDGLWADLTAEEHARYFEKLYGTKEAAAAVLEKMGLAPVQQRQVRTLSAGQKRRLTLSRLLFSPARLWLLDEPHTSLDAQGAAMLDDFIAAHRKKGGGVMLAQHGATAPADAHTLFLQGAGA